MRPDQWLIDMGLDRGALKATIVHAAKLLKMPGWGADGHVTGVRERVPLYRLWSLPSHIPLHRPAEFKALVAGIRDLGMLEPLVVSPFAKTPEAERTDAVPDEDLLILDGVARAQAAQRGGGLDEADVIVLPFGNIYQAVMWAVAAKAGQHGLSGKERTRNVLRLWEAYQVTQQRSPDTARPLPEPASLAPLLGLSPRQLAQRLRLAQCPRHAVASYFDGTVSLSATLAGRCGDTA